MPKVFKIQRTRLITETFRVRATDEEEAMAKLAESDTIQTGLDVEQIDLSTEHSAIELLDEVEMDHA